ncbi:tryptophan 7-halogenase [Candidatus Sumerlaeota bacterium]|nr:tryptophan 7-halogenase [Candidatus Sumerlaeota bacterium]
MGGGPAGATVSTLLAQRHRKVLLLEKDTFPRYHIGESLIPETYWPLKRIGVLDKIKASRFTKKFSVQFSGSSGKPSRPFYFFETNHHESAVTWQVTRAEFDKILLDHARDSGVEVREGATVKDVMFEGDRATGVKAVLGSSGGEEPAARAYHSRVVVDATGMTSLLAKKLGTRIRDPKLKKASIYGYFNGAMRDTGVDEGATLVLRTPRGGGWFWVLPLADDVTSVGVVADPDYLFKGRGKDYRKILFEEIERCEAVRSRVKEAKFLEEVYVISDFSYRSTRCAGPGYVLIGDAYGFLDPVYSSGVFLALISGEMAADSIHDAFEHDDFSAERLGAFGSKLSKGIESFRKLVYAFYTDGFSFGQFMRKNPQYRKNLIDLLVGNIFYDGVDDIFGPMGESCDLPEPLVGSSDEPARARGAKKKGTPVG